MGIEMWIRSSRHIYIKKQFTHVLIHTFVRTHGYALNYRTHTKDAHILALTYRTGIPVCIDKTDYIT